MTSILINGALGKMGKILASCAAESGFSVIAGIDKFAAGAKLSFPLFETLDSCHLKADVLIDFSRPDALCDILSYALKNKTALVLATTGYTKEQEEGIEEASKSVPIFKTANMSIGVNVLLTLATRAAADLAGFDIEIVEKHHNTKVDAPSGTALLLAGGIRGALRHPGEYVYGRDGIAKRESGEIGIHAVRGGTVTGEHEVFFFGNDETVSLSHHAASRRIFALGALKAADFVSGKEPGLYDMQDLLLQNAGVTHINVERGQALATIHGATAKDAAKVFKDLAALDVNLDMIAQSIQGEALSFTLSEKDLEKAKGALAGFALIRNAVKLTAAGLGMERQKGIAAGIFESIATLDISPLLVTTSETQVSLLLLEKDAERAAQNLKLAYRM